MWTIFGHLILIFDLLAILIICIYKLVKEILEHDKYITHNYLSMVHNDYIMSIKFNRTNLSIISASSDNKNPLKISFLNKRNKEYNFNLDKVIIIKSSI